MVSHQRSANVHRRIVLSNHGTQGLWIGSHQQKCNGSSPQRTLTTPLAIEGPPFFFRSHGRKRGFLFGSGRNRMILQWSHLLLSWHLLPAPSAEPVSAHRKSVFDLHQKSSRSGVSSIRRLHRVFPNAPSGVSMGGSLVSQGLAVTAIAGAIAAVAVWVRMRSGFVLLLQICPVACVSICRACLGSFALFR